MRTFSRSIPLNGAGVTSILINGQWISERDVIEAADQINHGLYIEQPLSLLAVARVDGVPQREHTWRERGEWMEAHRASICGISHGEDSGKQCIVFYRADGTFVTWARHCGPEFLIDLAIESEEIANAPDHPALAMWRVGLERWNTPAFP